MSIKIYKRNTAARRNMSIVKSKMVTDKRPEKFLLAKRVRLAGRSGGKISVRHQGGGNKQRYRIVDFQQDKFGIPGKVVAIERDPVRTSFIALINYVDGERRYILAPEGLKINESIVSKDDAPIKIGNRAKIKNIPVGTFVYNIEIKPGSGSKLVRSAGSFAQVVANDASYTHIKMPSSEIRKIHENAWASIGAVSNEENRLVNIGKAGRSRWMGIRPTVRGTAQNPVDHPYGGGEQRQGRGLRRLKTRWGKPAGKGQKTRTPKKYSNVFIVSRRQVGKKKAAVQQ